MGHYAICGEAVEIDGHLAMSVEQVVVVANEVMIDPETEEESEAAGRAHLVQCGYDRDRVFQTSYHGNMRGSYASIGGYYLSGLDVFVPGCDFSSWSLDALGVWRPPVPMPDDGLEYFWAEDTLSWIEIAPDPEV